MLTSWSADLRGTNKWLKTPCRGRRDWRTDFEASSIEMYENHLKRSQRVSVLASELMFPFKRPDLVSSLCTQLESRAATGARAGEAKQAALNEFIMQKQSLKAPPPFFFLHGSCYLLIIAQTWQIEPLTVHSEPAYVFTPKLISISMAAAGRYESEAQQTSTDHLSCTY